MERENLFNRLPPELLEIIFKYLDIPDLKSTALVCKRFYKILNQRGFAKLMPVLMKFTMTSSRKFPDIHSPIVFRRYFPVFSLKANVFDEPMESFFHAIGQTVKRFSLYNCCISPVHLKLIVNLMPNLEYLLLSRITITATDSAQDIEIMSKFPNLFFHDYHPNLQHIICEDVEYRSHEYIKYPDNVIMTVYKFWNHDGNVQVTRMCDLRNIIDGNGVDRYSESL